MPRLIHFEIPAKDPENCIKFYEKVFGWQFRKWEGDQDYWVIRTGDNDRPGIDGGLLRMNGLKQVVDTIEVTSLDESVRMVKANGGEIVKPKSSIPGVGYLAYFKDTEGHMFGMLQGDSSAK